MTWWLSVGIHGIHKTGRYDDAWGPLASLGWYDNDPIYLHLLTNSLALHITVYFLPQHCQWNLLQLHWKKKKTEKHVCIFLSVSFQASLYVPHIQTRMFVFMIHNTNFGVVSRVYDKNYSCTHNALLSSLANLTPRPFSVKYLNLCSR